MKGSTLWRGADAIMLLAFLFSIAVQFNDPDPLPWIAIYGLGAAACASGLLDRGHWAFPVTVGAIAMAWAATIAPRVLRRTPFLDMFEAFEMRDLGVEESREMYGLAVVAAWMAVLAVRMARAGEAAANRGTRDDPTASK